MERRQERGQVLAKDKRIRRIVDGKYLVPSQSGSGQYLVDTIEHTCSCPDYETRGHFRDGEALGRRGDQRGQLRAVVRGAFGDADGRDDVGHGADHGVRLGVKVDAVLEGAWPEPGWQRPCVCKVCGRFDQEGARP